MTQHPECEQSCTTPSSQVTVHPSRWFCRGAKLLVGVARHELSLPRPSAGPCKPLPLLHHSQIPRGWAPKSPLQSQWCEVRGGAPTECRTMLGRLVATVGSLFWLEEVVPLAVGGRWRGITKQQVAASLTPLLSVLVSVVQRVLPPHLRF